MGQTFGDLLNDFIRTRDAEYRTDPEMREAWLSNLSYTVQTMLEMLRDQFDPD